MTFTKQEIKERNRDACKKYREAHPERKKANGLKWYYSHPEQSKANRDIQNPKRDHKRLFTFKDKQIMHSVRPRTGICTNCHEERLTNLHHTKYDEVNPLAHTVELCVPCHNSEHKRLRGETSLLRN